MKAFGAVHATLAYAALAIWATWPLALGLGHDVAWDLGDPVLVIWALAWNGSRLLDILAGDVSKIGTYFDANIFAPAPHTLAYSEHFFAQAVQVLPVYAVTGNAILCYNLLFLSTFVLSGLGTFLFVRALTGSTPGAFTAGLLFAFAPYRFPQASHLQVLSSQWMPLALFGFRRYFDTRRMLPLAGAAAALIVQNLSCGYYLLYFSPFAAAYVVSEIAARRLWRDAQLWRQLTGAAGVVLLATVPFLLPYATLRTELRADRSLAEVRRYSADVYSYLTAFSDQPLWGRVAQAFPKPEGQLFPGVTALLLALVGLVPSRRGTAPTGRPVDAGRWRHRLAVLLVAGVVVHLAAAAYVLFARRIHVELGPVTLQAGDITQLLLRTGALGAILLAVSPRARRHAAAYMQPRGVFLVGLAAAVWLSLGPAPAALGRPLDLAAPYRLLYDYVPGFDGVRVPARFWMIGSLALAVLGGLGAARLAGTRAGLPALVLACAVFLGEGMVSPFVVNGAGPIVGLNAPEPRLRAPDEAPAVYRAVAARPPGAVLAELPLGQPDYDVRAMYYSTMHWHKLLNGYSGFYPAHYGPLVAALSRATEHPDEALVALRSAGATLVLIHEGAFRSGDGARLTATLRQQGVVEVFREGTDVLLALDGPAAGPSSP